MEITVDQQEDSNMYVAFIDQERLLTKSGDV